MSEEGGTGQMPHHDSGNNNRHHQQSLSSSFLPEPFPTASTSHIHANANHNNSSNTTNSNSNSNANHGGQAIKNINSLHLHDAFGDNDSGVDYGPPNEFEDDDDDDVSMGENDANNAVIVEGVQKSLLLNDQSMMIQQGGHDNDNNGIHNAAAPAAPTNTNLLLQQMKMKQQSSSQPNQQQLSIQSNDAANQSTNNNNNIHNLISIEELEEEVALHELTLTSLTSKLSTLSSQITHQTSTCHLHRTQLQMLNGRKMVLRKKTEGSCKLVKELEKSIEWAVGRLKMAVAVDELNNTAAASTSTGSAAATKTGEQQGSVEQAEDQHVDEQQQQHQQQQQADQETTLKAKAEETNEGIQDQPIVVDEGMTHPASDDGDLLAETDTVCHTSATINANAVGVSMNVVDIEKTKQAGAKIPIQTTDKQQGSSSSSGGLGRRFQPPSRQSSFMSERGGTAERRTEGKKKQPQQQPLGRRFIPPAAAKRGTAMTTTAVEEDAAKVVPQQQSTTTTQNTTIKESSSPNNIMVIPLKSSQQLQSSSHTIAWPSPKLVRKIHRESQSLPVNVPTFRTHPIGAASTILGGLDTVELIQEVMNCSVLERLLQRREEHQAEEEGQLTCGWVNEVDIWGTSLDVFTHVNWKYLFAGLKRLDEGTANKNGDNNDDGATGDDGASSAVDPNVILCPYELGGTCADDQCPYQHLSREKNHTDTHVDHHRAKKRRLNDGSGGKGEERYDEEGSYVRYNNLPNPKLPRSFVKEDFFIIKKRNEEVQPSSANEATVSSVEEAPGRGEQQNSLDAQQKTTQQLYQCPVCLGEETYNQEELKGHMGQCKLSPSTMLIDNRPVTVRHVLQNPEEARGANVAVQERLINAELEPEVDDRLHATGDNNLDATDSDSDVHPSDKRPSEVGGEDDVLSSDTGVSNDPPEDHLLNTDSDDDEASTGEPVQNEKCSIQDNLDYVCLPSDVDSTDGSDAMECGDDLDRSGDARTVFDNRLWWQQLDSSAIPVKDIESDDGNTFDHLLLAFGFERSEEAGRHALRYTKSSSPAGDVPVTQKQRELDDLIFFSRLIDLSRILVHMGRDSFVLSAFDSVSESRVEGDPHKSLLKSVFVSIQSLSHSRGAQTMYQVQLHLHIVSEMLHAHHDSVYGQGGSADQDKESLTLDKLLYLIRNLRSENRLLPDGFDRLLSCLPSPSLPAERWRNRSSSSSQPSPPPSTPSVENDIWATFVKTLRLMMEKFIIIPYSELKCGEQLVFLTQCVSIGKFLGYVGRMASKQPHFAPYLHALEPTWTSLQLLLQRSTTRRGEGVWLQADVISLAVIGPLLFGCVADTVAPPSGETGTSRKLPPKFDARARANVSSLDKVLVEILKELSRFSRRGNRKSLIEPLMSPLYGLSATISVSLGSLDKALVRLEHVLNKEGSSSSVRNELSLYALSEMIWSQLLQIRMLCPSYTDPLNPTTTKSNNLVKSTLPTHIVDSHIKLATRIVGNGVSLWGVKMRADTHMNIISPCLSHLHCTEWEKASRSIFTQHPQVELQTGEFCIANAYPELDGVKDRVSVFPETLFLLRKSLITLSLENCGLTRLPTSIGHNLTNLKSLNLSNNLLLEIPSSISYLTCLEVLNVSHNCLKTFPKLSKCTNLRVIDVSHNQLATFPADLALQCHNLQSLLVEGNPASNNLAQRQKRLKAGN